MPDQTRDIQDAIALSIEPGETITLAELDDRLYSAYPQLQGDPRWRWVGAALTRMLGDGRLVALRPQAQYADDFQIRRPEEKSSAGRHRQPKEEK